MLQIEIGRQLRTLGEGFLHCIIATSRVWAILQCPVFITMPFECSGLFEQPICSSISLFFAIDCRDL